MLCNGLKSDFMTCACTSPSDSELRKFRTSDSASQLVRIARSGPTRTYRHWHSALSAATSPPPSGLLHSWPWLGPATQNARQLIWNPDHMDRNWKNSIDMYLTCTYMLRNVKHVHTWYVHVYTMYVQIGRCTYMSIHLCKFLYVSCT